jgi:undecaprenyl-diphosphatase
MELLHGLDWGTYYWFTSHPTPWLQPVMLDLSALGGPAILVLVVLAGLSPLLAMRYHGRGLFILAAIMIGVGVGMGVQFLTASQRPEASVDWLNEAHVPAGFPTGNALDAAVVYLTLALLTAPLVSQRSVRIVVISIGAGLAFVTGVSQLYLGLHFLTDMLKGWLLGLAWALVCRGTAQRWLAGP